MNAEQLARTFAARFLADGNYEALGSPTGDRGFHAFSAATNGSALDSYFSPDDGFSGLAVQSVGYTRGAEREEVGIYVTKGSQRALKTIPGEVEGVRVVASVMGRLKTGPAVSSGGNLYERNGRIACGSSLAPSGETYAGTLGAFAAKGPLTYALSNNHVLAACNHTPLRMPVLSPATADARPGRRAPTAIGEYADMIEIRSGIPGLVTPMTLDAAIAEVGSMDLVSSWQGDSADGYDTPGGVAVPRSRMRVKKIGRTTGFTTGQLEAFVPTPWILPYKSGKFTAQVWFADTWTIRGNDGDPFALPGDSGSLVVAEDGSGALGLVFAVNASGGYAIMCELGPMLAKFDNLELLSGHGV